ncbi:MAG: hypothetical protein K2M14_07190, partial [Muribaculaceae bacterium]|nr:hypothetical protein [Muribaculaceae bacterium]
HTPHNPEQPQAERQPRREQKRVKVSSYKYLKKIYGKNKNKTPPPQRKQAKFAHTARKERKNLSHTADSIKFFY